MSKNLAIFFDGTWNEPNDRTNAYALYMAAPETESQETLYVEGVGTKGQGIWSAIDRFLGGAFGVGLSANVRAGYTWLSQRHRVGDRIFLVGFSRGAYTARSVAGMIRKCGLLNDPSQDNVDEAYAIYRDDSAPSSNQAKGFRTRYSRETDIQFVGVWDTVGALGIPIGGIPIPGFANFYHFHDTELSNSVIHAYHAVAANEFRVPYFPTFWTRLPKSEPRPSDQPVEQRWFIGAHADVGGGYKNGILQSLPGAWLQEKSSLAGLDAGPTINVPTAYMSTNPHDSYSEFSKSVPVHIQKNARKWDAEHVLNLTIDDTLFERLNSIHLFLRDYPDFRRDLLALRDVSHRSNP